MNNKIIVLTVIENGRADKIISELIKPFYDASRTQIQKWISKKAIKINNEILQNNKMKLKIDDEIQIEILEPTEYEITPEKLNIEIIYEDQHLLILNKPNNLVVHPGAGNWEHTLVHGLMHQIKDLSQIGDKIRPGIVHRLDKQTEGLMIVAKTEAAHKKLVTMFANNEVHKDYYALVHGVIYENEGIINAPIGRHSGDRKKMTVTDKNSKRAVTNFHVLERFEDATLISCNIETGRTHQIRVHMKFINHPVIGDPLYGFISDRKDKNGQCLQAYKLEFNHPITNERLLFEIKLSTKISDRINMLKVKVK
ncbi:RluA family pseudouridine synthase [Spiroplasma endosymbiont of Labia minor]|uniref:RluA family pseudouridine synthase n=1 Tax=Spiroplasma endosymbiont of Labia minor TaxID=3066305 RepID=UPI0030D4411C